MENGRTAATRLNEQSERTIQKTIQEQGVDPRKIVLVTEDKRTFDTFSIFLPQQFELRWPEEVGFTTSLPNETPSLVNCAFNRALKVAQSLREQDIANYTVVTEATELKIETANGDITRDYRFRYPESDIKIFEDLLEVVENDPEHKASLSCVLTIVPCGSSTGKIWSCAGATHGKIIAERRGTGLFPLDEYFAVYGLGGKTLAEIPSKEYCHYSHYVRAIQHMLDRFPYGR